MCWRAHAGGAACGRAMWGGLRPPPPLRRRWRSTPPRCCPPLLQFKVPPATSAIITNGTELQLRIGIEHC